MSELNITDQAALRREQQIAELQVPTKPSLCVMYSLLFEGSSEITRAFYGTPNDGIQT